MDRELGQDGFTKRWINSCLHTDTCEREVVERMIVQLYANCGFKAPLILWCGSPVCLSAIRLVYARYYNGADWPINHLPLSMAENAIARKCTQASDIAAPVPPGRRAVRNALQGMTMMSSNDTTWGIDAQSVGDFYDVDKMISDTWKSRYSEMLAKYTGTKPTLGSIVATENGPTQEWRGRGRMDQADISLSLPTDRVQIADYAWKNEQMVEPMQNLLDLCLSAEMVVPYQRTCFVSERKIAVHVTHSASTTQPQILPTPQAVGDDTVLHKDGGPALAYPDGMRWWYLNGIRVPKQIAETPSTELDPRLVLTEKNVDIRREIVRKIGAERLCIGLKAKCIDQWEDYRLLVLDLGDGRRRPYLEMKNRSVNVIHIEGVAPDCLTVKKALAWRNGHDTYVPPKVLT